MEIFDQTGPEREQIDELSPDQVDMVFTREAHTGDRVRRSVAYALENPTLETDHKRVIEILKESSEETFRAYVNMLKELPDNERVAYERVLLEDLKDFYYSHYNAVRNRLGDSNKISE